MARKRLLDRIKDSLAKEGIPARTNAARQWLQAKIGDFRLNSSAKMGFVNASGKSKKRLSTNYVGRMYFYMYDPKTKDKMKYYDTFPLVIPITPLPDGFIGLNLHYLHPKYRMILLDKLSDILTNNNYDDRTRMRISYDYLKSNQRIFEATPCIKRYLFTHVRSKFLEITADEWEIAAMLPFEQFKKAPTSKVWADSRKKF